MKLTGCQTLPLALSAFSHDSALFSSTPRADQTTLPSFLCSSLFFSFNLEFPSQKPCLPVSYPVWSLPLSFAFPSTGVISPSSALIHSIVASLTAHGIFLSVSMKNIGLRVSTLAQPLSFFVTLGKSSNCPVLQFPYLRRGCNSSLGAERVQRHSTWKWT